MDELLARYEEWNDFLIRIRDEDWNVPLGEGKWSIHDVVSHILFWDRYFRETAVERIAKGLDPTWNELDFDRFNREAAEKGRRLSKEELIEQTRKCRKAILDTIRSMDEVRRSGTYTDADGEAFDLEAYLKEFVDHDRHHMRQIEEVLLTSGRSRPE